MQLFAQMLAQENPLNHVVQHDLHWDFLPEWLHLNNHMLMVVLAGTLMVIILPLVARQRSMVPKGLRNFFEAICLFIREEIARPVLGHNTDKFMPYLWTTFFFILFCNLLGMIPLDGILFTISGKRLQHYGGTATANIWITGTLAVFAFFMIHISGIREQGAWLYIKNFIPHVPWPMIPFMYFLEFIGALVKPFALAIRLFANMMAGHTVIASLMGLAALSGSIGIAGITILGCVAISLLELFVAFLQAYIFTYLTTMFIGAAVHP
ncbi:MAG: F0F1 ATP synthase subunit A, partial [Planctomycetes bacterium]|nr:F0F1 ATP synthase subunit A [Planctomycetota bacterium]